MSTDPAIAVLGMGASLPQFEGVPRLKSLLREAPTRRIPDLPSVDAVQRSEDRARAVILEALTAARLDSSSLRRAALVGGLGLAEEGVLEGVATVLPSLDRLAAAHGIGGPRVAVYSACATGTDALGMAVMLLRAGEAREAVVVASDCPNGDGLRSAFSRLGVLAGERPDMAPACRAFCSERNGFVLSEGAACLVLRVEAGMERPERTRERVLIHGYGTAIDQGGPISPSTEKSALADAIHRALCDAGWRPAAVDVVNSHGTGTIQNDIAESRALYEVFGERAREIPIVANKSVLGHSIAAAGLLETVAAVVGLLDEELHGNPWLARPDLTLGVAPIGPGGRSFPHHTVLKCSAAFGGNNAAVLLGKERSGGDCSRDRLPLPRERDRRR